MTDRSDVDKNIFSNNPHENTSNNVRSSGFMSSVLLDYSEKRGKSNKSQNNMNKKRGNQEMLIDKRSEKRVKFKTESDNDNLSDVKIIETTSCSVCGVDNNCHCQVNYGSNTNTNNGIESTFSDTSPSANEYSYIPSNTDTFKIDDKTVSDAFNDLLMSWYYSGYATGRYQTLLDVQKMQSQPTTVEPSISTDDHNQEL